MEIILGIFGGLMLVGLVGNIIDWISNSNSSSGSSSYKNATPLSGRFSLDRNEFEKDL